MDPTWEAVMYNYTMRHFRARFYRVIEVRRRANPDEYGKLNVQQIIYNAGAKCLAEGKPINYVNVLDNLCGKVQNT